MNKEYRLFSQSREVVKSFLDTITEENYYPGLSVNISIVAGHWCISSRNFQIDSPIPDLRITKEEIEEFMKVIKESEEKEAARMAEEKARKEKEEEDLLNKI